MSLTACAQTGVGGEQRPGLSPDHSAEAFAQRATEVVEAWRAASGRQAWETGYVPLQDPTVLPADPGFDDDTKQAFVAGWYREAIPLPSTRPADGTIRFPDGTLTVPLVSAAEAYRQLGAEPPPCAGRPGTPPPSPSPGPDGAVGHNATSPLTRPC